MEIAHHLNELQDQWGVDLVLFDGEELVYGNDPRVGEYFLGSRSSPGSMPSSVERRRTRMRYEAGIVLDMVGGTQPQDQAGAQQPRARSAVGPPGLGGRQEAERQVVQPRDRPRSPGRPPRLSIEPASPPSTSSTSTIRSGTRPTTCRKTARPKAWPKSAEWSQRGSPYRYRAATRR